MALVGLTTSVPVEVIYAAGHTPVDLNNVFITDPDPYALVAAAEAEGFARSLCAWIKGIYAVLTRRPDITLLVAVTQGDCSNTHALVEVLASRGLAVLRFDYPPDKDPKLLKVQIERMVNFFGTSWAKAQYIKGRLDGIRAKLKDLDRLTWRENKVSGQENHLWQVSSSDFNQDPARFEAELDEFLSQVRPRPPFEQPVRLGLLGIPPIMSGLYEAVEELGGRVVFNEIQRQFAMPSLKEDLVAQYLSFTYPYDVFGRIEDIAAEAKRRGVAGLIHYTQSFCFRQVQDIVLRQELNMPILTIEGDKPGPLDARTRLRLEAFIDVLRD